jgi:flagellar hook protein FlgE
MSLIGTLTSGVSAMESFEQGLSVIGNNIANVNTTAFKSGAASYADSFSNILQSSTPAPGTGSGSNTNTVEVGTGVSVSGVSTNYGQGSLSSTGVASDLAVSGNGFFIVKDPSDSSTFATRAGNFTIDSSGYLVTTQGYRVQGLTGGTSSAAPATLGDIKLGTPPSGTALQSYTIDGSGNLTESYSDGTTATTNQVLLQNFQNPSALTSVAGNLYSGMAAADPTSGSLTLSAASNTAGTNGLGSVQSGALELSNVDLTTEFANLITTQRSFEAGSRLITVSDTILEDIVNLKTR